MLIGDWFDLVLATHTYIVVLLIVSIYTSILLIWSGFYMSIDGLEGGPLSFQEAFAFALETATTVGFGLVRDDMFFEGNPLWVAAIYFECIFFLIFNGLILGTIMMRIQRANRRARWGLFLIFREGCFANLWLYKANCVFKQGVCHVHPRQVLSRDSSLRFTGQLPSHQFVGAVDCRVSRNRRGLPRVLSGRS
jgi:hypothetical protein